MKIAYIFRHHPAYPRSTKECNSLVQAGHQVTFVGWDIRPEEKREHELLPEVKLQVLTLAGEYGRLDLGKWLRWYWHMLSALYCGKFDAIHCVDEYPVLMLFPFKHLLFRFIVLDVYDSIIKRKANNVLASLAFRAARWLTNSVSDRIIETSDELRDTLGRFARKSAVIFNSPVDPGPWVEQVFPTDDQPVQIAVTGGLSTDTQALHTLVEALNILGPKVQVRCCGRLQDDFARDVFIKHPAVQYQWLDRMSDYFRLLCECDLVFNLRADGEASHYRSLVFPQKLFDAMAVGRPAIVARENWVAEWVKKQNLGFACSFRDAQALAGVIEQCRQKRAALPAFSRRSRHLFKSHYEWALMEKRLVLLYSELTE